MSKTKGKLKVKVDIEFGSNFQEDLIVSLMSGMLTSIQSFFEKKHKDNKLMWNIGVLEDKQK